MSAWREHIRERRQDDGRASGDGRRRYPRVDLALEGIYCSPERALFGSTLELNLRGLFLRTPVPDAEGVKASLRLITPGAVTLLNLPVRVRWSNEDPGRGPVGMALQFEGLQGWQMKRLAALLLKRAGWRGLGISAVPAA